MVNAGLKCFKYILFVLTFLQFLFAVANVAGTSVGIYRVNHNLEKLGDLDKDTSRAGLYTMLGINLLWAFIAFLGCCGAAQENSCMLKAFAGINLAFLILTIIAISLIVGLWDKLLPEMNKRLHTLINNYGQNKTDNAIDELQQTFQCCGVDSMDDWTKAGHAIPQSCCAKENQESCDRDYAFKDGCISLLNLDHIWKILVAFGVITILLPLLIIVGTCYLACAIRKEYEVV